MTARLKESLVAVAVVGAVTVAFFFPLLNGGTFTTIAVHERATFPWRGVDGPEARPFPQTDQADLNLPWQTFETRALRDGIVPFWDPDSYAGGYPFLTNGSSAVLYPPRVILALIADPTTAHTIFSVFHIFLAGLLMFFFMKELGIGFAGSIFSGIAWMLSSFVLAWLHLEVVAPMALFIPLDLLMIRRAIRRGTARAGVAAVLALAVTLIAGHLILLGIVWLVAALYAIALTVANASRQWRRGSVAQILRPCIRTVAILALSLGAAAVVLLPTAAAVSDSARDPFTYARLRHDFLASIGDFRYTLSPPPLPVTMNRLHQMAFAGTATAILGIVGAFSRRPGGWLGRAMAAGVFAVAVGTPATWVAYHVIPGFDVFRPYSRLLILWTFAVALLGGLGLDVIVRRLWRRRDPAAPAISIGRMRKPLAAGIAAAALLGTAYQLGTYGRDINPPFVKTASVSRLYRPTPVIDRALEETRPAGAWPGRVLPLIVVRADGTKPAPTLFAAHHLLFGIDSASGYDSILPRRTARFLRLLQGDDPTTILQSGLSVAFAPRFHSDRVRFDLLRKAGIGAFVATPRSKKPEAWSPTWRPEDAPIVYDGPDGRLYRLDTPRGPSVIFRHEVVASEAAAIRRLSDPSFDERTTVIFEDDHEAPPDGAAAPAGVSPRARIITATRGVNSASISAETSAPGWLVLPDSWSAGWTARVNGRPVAVRRANYLRRAVRLPAGRSSVEFRYRPEYLGVGASISVATIVLLAAAPLARRRFRPTRSRPQSL